MGDHNAVDMVQALHVDILTSAGGIASQGFIKYKHALPASGVMEGIYIDDLIVILLAKERELRVGHRGDRDLIDAAHAAYKSSGLARSPGKAFGWGADRPGDSTFTAFGTRIRSTPGDAATPGEKRLLLAGLLMMSANIAKVPKALLDSLRGPVVHPLMHRRSLRPCLHRIFKFMNDNKAEKILPLPADIREELCYAALLMPVARTNLRAQVDTLITATDATPSSGGSVACTVSRRLAEALFRSV